MSMWSRLKVAVLTTAVVVAALPLSGCLKGVFDYKTILQYVVIDNIFD